MKSFVNYGRLLDRNLLIDLDFMFVCFLAWKVSASSLSIQPPLSIFDGFLPLPEIL